MTQIVDHETVAIIDGAAAPPVLRPVLAADAIARSGVALGDLYETFLAQGPGAVR